MPRLFKKIFRKVSLPPGTLEEYRESKPQEVAMTIFDYTEQGLEEKVIHSIDESFPYRDKNSVTWINIEGIDIKVIKDLDDHFGIHPLVSEDILDTGQRAKVEDYGEYNFIVIKMIYFDSKLDDMIAEQVSLILGPNYVISFQETQGDVFDLIRDRIRQAKGRIRKMGADYLAYSLLDAVVDNYFIILEKKGEEIEKLEEKLIDDGRPEISHEIHRYKRDMVFLRKQIWPLREVLSALQRGESKLIKKATGIYLRDVYDHTIQVMDTIESFRDMLSGMHDVHLSNVSNKMNEVMKVLTIFAAIFIPLTFLAGIYGMNFEYMPELHWRYGYFSVILLMLLISFSMILYFKKKGWF